VAVRLGAVIFAASATKAIGAANDFKATPLVSVPPKTTVSWPTL